MEAKLKDASIFYDGQGSEGLKDLKERLRAEPAELKSQAAEAISLSNWACLTLIKRLEAAFPLVLWLSLWADNRRVLHLSRPVWQLR